MAEVLVAGAGLLGLTYILSKDPHVAGDGASDTHEMPDKNMGVVVPRGFAAHSSGFVANTVAAQAPPETLVNGPREGGKTRANASHVASALKTMHRRNVTEQMAQSTKLFDPYTIAKFRNGGAAPLQMTFMTDKSRLVPWETSIDYNPYTLRGWKPIMVRSHSMKRTSQGFLPEIPAKYVNFEPSATRTMPYRTAHLKQKRARFTMNFSKRLDQARSEP